MTFPHEFQMLAFHVQFALEQGAASEEQLIREALKKDSPQAQQRLAVYLTEILDGRYNDEELDALWAKTGTDMAFLKPGMTRLFLTMVREYLPQNGPS